MADINIDFPFYLKMNLEDIEDRIPSVNYTIEVMYPYLAGKLTYVRKNVWFSLLKFELFIQNLKDLQQQLITIAELTDLSEYLKIKVKKRDEYSFVYDVEFRESSSAENCVSFNITRTISFDELAILKNAFEETSNYW